MFLSQIGVAEAATLMRVSQSRVRRLLRDGRISGFKHPDTGVWQMPYPCKVEPGKRGPAFGARPGPKRPNSARRGIVLVQKQF